MLDLGSPRHDLSPSPMISKEDLSKDSESRRRKADGRDMDRNHLGRNSDSYKSSDYYTSRSSRDYRRHDDRDKRDRHKSYSDRARQESDQYRSRDLLRNNDRNYSGHRSSRDREKETVSTEYKYKDSASHRTGSGKRHTGLTSEDNRSEDNRDARKDYMRNSGDRKNSHSHLYEESRGHRSDTSAQKNTDNLLSKDASKVFDEEMNDENNKMEKKDSEHFGTKVRYEKEAFVQSCEYIYLQQPGKRWDSSLFTDRERQEKFNKLMGVKGGEQKTEGGHQDHQADKQREEQLQLELEKQYTAGLRRRDGRTVGLGL